MAEEYKTTTDYRKRMRVEKLKRQNFAKKMIDSNQEMKSPEVQTTQRIALDDPTQPEWAKIRSLQQIDDMRSFTQFHTIEKVLQGHIRATQHLYVVPGKVHFFKYKLKNIYASKAVYEIKINDPDDQYLGG